MLKKKAGFQLLKSIDAKITDDIFHPCSHIPSS